MTGNVKEVWELSRHQHLTVLAAAWWLTGDERYAEAVADQLRSWWRQNPFLSGVHWTSGIELGVRLISLGLDPPPARRLAGGQRPLRAQRRRPCARSAGTSSTSPPSAAAAPRPTTTSSPRPPAGSSAACAFPWFAESDGWRETRARPAPSASSAANTFPSGAQPRAGHRLPPLRHRARPASPRSRRDAAGHPLGRATWALLVRIAGRRRRPRRRAPAGRPARATATRDVRCVLDDPDADPLGQPARSAARRRRPASTGGRATAPRPCAAARSARSPAGAREHRRAGRPQRPSRFADAGLDVLRTPPGDGPEIWCRCDGGPHGFLSIAAHAHADALSVEVRYGGVDILADPGPTATTASPSGGSYFRSTLGPQHVEVDGANQSVEGGPFHVERPRTTRVRPVGVGRR